MATDGASACDGRLMQPRTRSRRSLTVIFALLLLGTGVTAVLHPAVVAVDALRHDLDNRLRAPSRDHVMGTDAFGRDVLARLVHGSRASLGIALSGMVLSVVVGTVLGTASGYAGGLVDLVGQRLVDTFSAFPAMVMALVVVTGVGSSREAVVIAVVMALAPPIGRVARARCMEVKQEPYLLAARALGGTHAWIVARHVLPQVIPTVLVVATGFVGRALMLEAALSFLGLGVSPPTPSLGQMIQEGARFYLETAPWLTIFPGLTLSLVALSFAFVGDAARDALDPRHRRR